MFTFVGRLVGLSVCLSVSLWKKISKSRFLIKYQWTKLPYEIHDKNETRKRKRKRKRGRGRRRNRRRSIQGS